MKTAAIYARVSTTGQAKEGTSLDTQVAACRSFAGEQGYVVVKEVQEDRSGARLDRPGLRGIRDLAEGGQVSAVIVYDQDRLSRSLAHLMLLAEEFERRRVELLVVNAPRENTPEGNMLFQMKGLFAEYERSKIMERTRRGKEKRAREGKVMGSQKAPYGFVYRAGEFELVEEEARYVKKMFEWIAVEGCSLYEVKRRLDEYGAPNKQGARYWDTSSIHSILKNTIYTGTWYWGKTMAVVPRVSKSADRKNEKSGKVWRPKEEWIAISVPALITQELYDAAQAQLQRNREMSKRNCKREYLLRGLVVCKRCGYKLRGHTMGTQVAYECGSNNRLPKEERCTVKRFNAGKLEALVWGKISEVLTNPEKLRDTVETRGKGLQEDQDREASQLESLYAVKQSIKKEEDRLLDAYAAGVIDLSQLQGRLAVTKKKREAIEVEISRLIARTAKLGEVAANLQVLEQLCGEVRDGIEHFTFEDKRRVLDLLDVRVLVDGEKVVISGVVTGALVEHMSVGRGKKRDVASSGEEGGAEGDLGLPLHPSYRHMLPRYFRARCGLRARCWPGR